MHVGKSLPLDSYYMDDYVSAGNKWLAYWYCRDTDSTKEKKGPQRAIRLFLELGLFLLFKGKLMPALLFYYFFMYIL